MHHFLWSPGPVHCTLRKHPNSRPFILRLAALESGCSLSARSGRCRPHCQDWEDLPGGGFQCLLWCLAGAFVLRLHMVVLCITVLTVPAAASTSGSRTPWRVQAAELWADFVPGISWRAYDSAPYQPATIHREAVRARASPASAARCCGDSRRVCVMDGA